MNNSKSISLERQTLILLPEKAIFWEDQKTLIVSDVHLGKSAHFRKHGIAVPETINETNIHKLDRLIDGYEPKKIIFLGDLFHSERNIEVDQFKTWRRLHSNIEMILTIGNHDILTRFEFEKMGLQCVNKYEIEPFVFMHDEANAENLTHYPISGHIHPAVKLSSKGRQKIYVPCFYFAKTSGLLPAFGTFTGSFRIKPAQNDLVFGVVEDNVVDISSLI